MEKHIQLVGILNLVYRILLVLLALCLLAMGAWVTQFCESFVWHYDRHGMTDIPTEVIDLVSAVMIIIAIVMFVVSVVGIIGAVGVLQRKEWGRIMTLIVSFFNLLHVPIGTALGAYTLWVLMKDESVRMFNPTQGGQLSATPPPPTV